MAHDTNQCRGGKGEEPILHDRVLLVPTVEPMNHAQHATIAKLSQPQPPCIPSLCILVCFKHFNIRILSSYQWQVGSTSTYLQHNQDRSEMFEGTLVLGFK